MEELSQLNFAMICSANVNRSMAAHAILSDHKFSVKSFGTGTKGIFTSIIVVKIPGKISQVSFDFGTPYRKIYEHIQKDMQFYSQMKMDQVLERNIRIKQAPERWQNFQYINEFDVIICFSDRVFHTVVEGIFIV